MAPKTSGAGAAQAPIWSDEDVLAAYNLSAEVIRTRRFRGTPIPQWIREFHYRTNTERQARMTRSRQESHCGGAELVLDKRISAAEAANLLGWSKSTILRRATDLDGEIVGGRWIFRQSAVTEFREGLHDA